MQFDLFKMRFVTKKGLVEKNKAMFERGIKSLINLFYRIYQKRLRKDLDRRMFCKSLLFFLYDKNI